MSSSLSIGLASGGSRVYEAQGIDSIKFEFSQDAVDFVREGNTLVLSAKDGSGEQVLLNNYFSENEEGTPPNFELEDGTVVSGVDFLTNYEINTAAGPSNTTSGLNSYSDETESLVSGVDSLNSLGGANGSTSFVADGGSLLAANGRRGSGRDSNNDGADSNDGSDNNGDGGNTPTPDPIPTPDPTRVLDERVALHSTDTTSDEVTLSVNNPSNGTVDVTSFNPEYVTSFTINSDNSITLVLTDKGKEALASGDPLSLDLTVTVDGQSREVEVIANAPNNFTSSDADAAAGIDKPISYEHHTSNETFSGNLVAGGTVQSDITIETEGSREDKAKGDGVRGGTIQGTGATSVDITTTGGGIGLNATESEGNTLKDLGAVTITTTKGANDAVRATGATNTIENVDTLNVTGTVHATSYGHNIIDKASSVDVKGGSHAALSAEGGGSNTIKNVDDVTLTSSNSAISTSTGSNTISNGKNLTVTGATGIQNDSGEVTIDHMKHVEITGTTKGIDSTNNGGATSITNADDVTITGGVSASASAKNILDHNTNVTITGNKRSEALLAKGEGSNTISNADTVTLDTEGYNDRSAIKTTGKGFYSNPKSSENTIEHVDTLTVKGGKHGIETSDYGKTTIDDAKHVTISGRVSGVSTDLSGKTEITNAEDVTITGGKYGIETTSTDPSNHTTTTITGVDNLTITGGTEAIHTARYSDVKIEAENIEIHGGVSAASNSTNTIGSSSAITMTITAKGTALSATGQGSQNTIHAGSNSGSQDNTEAGGHISIVGGITASAGGVNIIETENGSNIITLNGPVSVGSLEVHNEGASWNQLVLTASNLEEFMQWYGKWLDKLTNDTDFASKLGVESVEITLPNGASGMSLEEWLAASGSTSVDDFNKIVDALHDKGVDVTYNNGDGEHHQVYQDQSSTDAASATSLFAAPIDDTHDSNAIASADDSHATRSVETTSSLSDDTGSSHAVTFANFTSTQDIHLSDADDTVQLVGSHYSNILGMGNEDDVLSINSVDGALLMGDENNHLTLAGDVILDHSTINSGQGYDVLELGDLSTLHDSNSTLNLSALADSLSGGDILDISGTSGSLNIDMDSLLTLGLDSADSVQYTLLHSDQNADDFDINNLSTNNTLVIKADSTDDVNFNENWHESGAVVSDGGHEYNVYTTSDEEGQYFILLQSGTMV